MARAAPTIAIVGGGFGGLYTATHLARSALAFDGADIVLIDSRNYFTFTPLLAEVAVGTLGREHVTYPFRILAKRFGFRFLQDTVRGIDIDNRIVSLQDSALQYDYLVVATGATPRFFGNKTLERVGFPFATVEDALTIRARVIQCMERAELTENPTERTRMLTFVVAGAGPSGVEVAGGIHVWAEEILSKYYRYASAIRVVLVAAGERILDGFDQDLAEFGLRRLQQRGLEVCTNTKITRASGTAVRASSRTGEEQLIPANTLIWTAGMEPGEWLSTLGLATERGALQVDDYLRVEGQTNVFAVGDAAWVCDERRRTRYPQVAPIALSQGIRAAGNIENHVLGRPMEPYQAFHAGKIVSLGGNMALVDILGFRLNGKLAWWLYRTAYVLKLVGLQNKIRVVVTLLMNRIFERDIAGDVGSVARGLE